ncbi:MFS transporter [Catenulispora sp. NL8]|uniref:MFS transporter n=1 Tax=Catenulispora pinistramenti TaxID=2705254 RepID=A0ABS5L750_9ACTN|nr:MFS transporter [Catenulispora pinistramenti]MBS2554065.1 MFS transporter [Catenulispora pinistramenti]
MSVSESMSVSVSESVSAAAEVRTETVPVRARWNGVTCLALGIFVIVTSEILPVGLLDPIASGFHVSAGTGGLLMTLPGLTAAVCAPLTTVAAARFDRRAVLAVFMAVLALANLTVAVAPAFWLVLVGRTLTGLVIGGYWSIGVGLSPRLVPSGSLSKATALVFAAVPVGSVVGVPLGTVLGHASGWRAPFTVLCVLSGLVCLALLRTLPPLPMLRATSGAMLAGLLRGRGTGVRSGLLVTTLVVIAHFGGYTYLAPFLRDTTGISESSVSVYLLIYGAAGILGTVVAGRTLGRSLRGTFAVSAALIAAATLLLPLLGANPFGALALLVLWGLAYGTVPACSKTWFSQAAPRLPEAAGVLFTASFQATLALGALLGGRVVDASSTRVVMVCAGGLALLTAAVVGAGIARTPDAAVS